MRKIFITLILALSYTEAIAEDKKISEIRQEVINTIPKVEEVCSRPIPLDMGKAVVSEYVNLGFLRKSNNTSKSSLENSFFSGGTLMELTEEGRKYARINSDGKLVFCAGKVDIKIKSIEEDKDKLYKVIVEIDKSHLADWVYDKGFENTSNGPRIKDFKPTEELYYYYRRLRDGTRKLEGHPLTGYHLIFKTIPEGPTKPLP